MTRALVSSSGRAFTIGDTARTIRLGIKFGCGAIEMSPGAADRN